MPPTSSRSVLARGRACAALFAVALGASGAAASEPAPPASSGPHALAVDAARSHARFTVAHVLVAQVTGEIPIASGAVVYGSSGTLPTRLEATLDPKRVASGDAKRDADLQAPDWFDTATYPTWRFSGDRIAARPGGFVVHGALTVHGTAQPCDLTVERLPPVGDEAHFRASTVVDRHGFGMHVTRADAMVGGRIRIDLDVLTTGVRT